MSFQTVLVSLWILLAIINFPAIHGEESAEEQHASSLEFNTHGSLGMEVERTTLEQDGKPKLTVTEDKLRQAGKKVFVEPGSYSILNEFSESEAAELGSYVTTGADPDDGWIVTILGVCCILAALSFFIWCVLFIMDYTSNDEMLVNEKDDDDETVEDEQELEYDDDLEDDDFDDEELYEEEEEEDEEDEEEEEEIVSVEQIGAN